MNDKLIFTDGERVYITLESKIRNWVKWLLILLNICLYSLVVFVLIKSTEDEKGSIAFAALAMTIAFFWILTRPTLWNVYGRECIVIAIDNFSYYRDYGFYKTNYQNIKLDYGLFVCAENTLVYEDEPYVLIIFSENLSDENYQEILTTSIKTPQKNYDAILELLDELYGVPDDPHQFFSN